MQVQTFYVLHRRFSIHTLINVFVNAAVKVGLYNTWRFIDSLTNIGFSGRTVCQKICLLTVTNHCFT